MSSSNRAPSRQPAGVPVGGQFATESRSRSAVSLDTADSTDSEATQEAEFRVDGKTAFVAALKAIKRDKPARARIVWNYDAKKKQDSLPVIDVPEGTVLTFEARSGIPHVVLGSGRMVYRAASGWGNTLTVHGGEAHVCTDTAGGQRRDARKVRVEISPPDAGAPGSPHPRIWPANRDQPTVTCSPGEQWEHSRMYVSDTRTPPPPGELPSSAVLDEVECDRWGVPQEW